MKIMKIVTHEFNSKGNSKEIGISRVQISSKKIQTLCRTQLQNHQSSILDRVASEVRVGERSEKKKNRVTRTREESNHSSDVFATIVRDS